MANIKRIQRQEVPFDDRNWPEHMPRTMQQIYANRGISSEEQSSKDPTLLLNPHGLMGMEGAVDILVDAIVNNRYITVAGDYDCDGATGAAVGVMGLRLLGAEHDRVRFTIPDRDKHGYGLTVGLVNDMPPPTDLIVTVDSGIASVEGVAHAKSLGYTVVITDHHLPGKEVPNADAMVNPNQDGDKFNSKALAGVGVMFYVLLAVRTRLKKMGLPGGDAQLFQSLAPLVAIGTVADLVALDHNNRIIVSAGLGMIRSGRVNAGLRSLIQVSGKTLEDFTSTDIAFAVAPRLNAAGRLSAITLGARLLMCQDPKNAMVYAQTLDEINGRRKDIQAEMVLSAEAIVANLPVHGSNGVVVSGEGWHHGVVGLVASKLKESLHRPVVAFAPVEDGKGESRGSGRSIPGVHLRDVLAAVDAMHPGLLLKFGGHAMAAGMSIKTVDIPKFEVAFRQILDTIVTADMLDQVIYTDGELQPVEMSVEFAKYIEACGPWGQAFPKPVFDGIFEIVSTRVMGGKHQKFEVYDTRQGDIYEAIWFFSYDGKDILLPAKARLAYELSINYYGGRENIQLLVRQLELLPAD